MTVLELRQVLRTIRRQPVFAACVIAVIALAVGANTAIFTVVNAVLIRPLPLVDPDRLITFTIVRPGTDRQPLSLPDVVDFEQFSQTVAGLASLVGLRAN